MVGKERRKSYLQEYNPAETSTGKPKYYAMFGGATGVTDTTSGRLFLAPATRRYLHYLKFITKLFQMDYLVLMLQLILANTLEMGYLYACLVEAYGYLKGPIDMLTLYENKYKQEVEKFAAEQLR